MNTLKITEKIYQNGVIFNLDLDVAIFKTWISNVMFDTINKNLFFKIVSAFSLGFEKEKVKYIISFQVCPQAT